MKYKIELNDEDYMNFNVFYSNHTKFGKHQQNKLRILCLLGAALFIMIFVIEGVEHELLVGRTITVLIITGIWCVFTPQIMKMSIRRHISKMKKDGKLPYHAEAEVEFQDSMIVERSKQGEVHVNYRDIENVYSDKDCLYIFYSVTQAIIIPYHCLGEDRERVTEYVMSRRG